MSFFKYSSKITEIKTEENEVVKYFLWNKASEEKGSWSTTKQYNQP